MKFLLACCVLLFSFTLPAQITQATLNLLTKTMDLLEKGEYEKIIPIAEKASAEVKKEVGEDDPIYINLFFMLGICHYNLYHYAEAEKNYLRQKDLLVKTSGENDKTYAACLSRLAGLYRDMGKYQQSIALFLQVRNITKTLLGSDDADYSKCVNNLALLYSDIGEYAKAEQLYIESGEILKRTLGESNATYASNLNNLGTLYSSMGRYEKALSLLTRVLEIRKNVLGENHPDYGEALNNLASLYLSMGKYEEAEAPYIRATAIFKKSWGESSPYYAVGLSNLAQFYEATGKYEKSEKLYLEAIAIRKKVLGEEHADYAMSLSNLAGLYVVAGQYEKAEALYIQSKEIMKNTFGEGHPDYATSLNNLASLYESRGEYKKAEPLYLQSVAIKKKLLGETHPGYAIGLNNLAFLYYNIGQYEKTEPIFIRATEIIKAAMGENNPDYAIALNNLANVWQSMEQYTKAEAAFIKGIQINKKILGIDHNDYALGLNNLASLYTEQGQYKKAEPLVIQARDIWKKSLGENSPAYATGTNNLAAFYRKTQTQYAKAETLYLEAIQLRKNILGEHHPYYSESQNDLALLYTHLEQYKKAEPLFLSSSTILLQNIAGTFSILSEKEKGKYLAHNRKMIECNNSFLYSYKDAPAAVIENNYNLELGIKSFSLADTKNMLELIRDSKDTAVKRIFNEWTATKMALAKQYALAETKRTADLKTIEAEAERLEKELNRRSSAFSSQQKALRVKMQDVQKNLEEGEAAIEFIKFKFYNKKWTDSVIYGAFIISKNDATPHFVALCERKQLQQLFDSAGTTASKLVKNFYRGLDIKTKEARLGTKLYQLIWAPLEPFLKGIKKIAYSPAGKLYSVAFHALPIDSTTILMDKYQLQQYTSTRQVALRSGTSSIAKPGSIALFGDAQFSMDSLELVQQRKNKNNGENNLYISRTRSNENGVWVSLPGTAEEIKKIGQLFQQNKIITESFVQASASEDNLKTLSGKSPQIVHIATHGFFLPDQKKKKSSTDIQGNAYSLAEDPLMRSGLVFAGGNYAWGGKPQVDGIEDGIATAYEISQLNLSHTELLVLSACETALGDIKGTEGVFGLQRGFKMAGVKKMIVSLWQVPDKETAELMTAFYTYWMNGKAINEAFYEAQAELRKKYPAYYWAAFVLVE